ncbi:MAG: SDR family NAD(P)-dependent oxidoreductase, partial [Candidatus Eremiobacteraeota bacterium]|nr:SDR family NAD(P)-dependent oxidoreductase [Candidatus Eremiobacteraeota bacterium]
MKVMIVTGASSGIGRALALRAARAGYDVVAIARDRARLDALAQRVADEGGRMTTATLDIGEPGAARAIVELTHRSFGRIDVLVNNAGQAAAGPLWAQSDEALQ